MNCWLSFRARYAVCPLRGRAMPAMQTPRKPSHAWRSERTVGFAFCGGTPSRRRTRIIFQAVGYWDQLECTDPARNDFRSLANRSHAHVLIERPRPHCRACYTYIIYTCFITLQSLLFIHVHVYTPSTCILARAQTR